MNILNQARRLNKGSVCLPDKYLVVNNEKVQLEYGRIVCLTLFVDFSVYSRDKVIIQFLLYM